MEVTTWWFKDSLGIRFFQKSAPELVLSERFGEHETVVAGGDAVVHDHIDPLAVTPELSERKTEQIKNRKSVMRQGKNETNGYNMYHMFNPSSNR